jgi:hypothetical protein
MGSRRRSDQLNELSMIRPAIKPAEKLEIQLKKWLNRGHLRNVVLHPTYAHSGLPPGDKFLADIIDKTGCSIPFTESGFLVPERGFICYVDVKRVNWISKDRTGFNRKKKSEIFDR